MQGGKKEIVRETTQKRLIKINEWKTYGHFFKKIFRKKITNLTISQSLKQTKKFEKC